jgi:hypothetical protein
MRRTVLGFALRNTEDIPADDLAQRVAQALGIALDAGLYHGIRGFSGKAFGMTIGLFEWGGPHDTMLHALEGEVEDAAFVMFPNDVVVSADRIDISDAVADVLSIRGGGDWHRPTPDELEAHTRYSRQHED